MNQNYNYKNIEIGLGLNLVDNLNPSKYFYEVVNSSDNYDEALEKIQHYYQEQKNSNSSINTQEKECDIITLRIAKILEEDAFVFSPQTLKQIHKKLFEGVFESKLNLSVGNFRRYNILKGEDMLNGRSVIYGDHEDLQEYLTYDFNEEAKIKYASINTNEQIKKFSSFISRIWQIHPFAEGNTRTMAIFAIKYLNKLGFEIDNSLFKDNSKYFRNALFLSNFSDVKFGIGEDISYLDSFFAKLMIDTNLELKIIQNPYSILETSKNKVNLE
ncbi:cell filamentation protein Fic [Campylobacter fetus]|uniref:Fic family protein n=1 Tax=Campylobacter fetus TaxID=196 RepID=UPI000508EAF2|nr:Fic family protein [Campylobacter fetus]WKW17946.1 Fic family protein [Campylobacter fetus subsp. fetus]AIR78577.1 Fic domain protein [Campylobacter fetus subsp. fetus 04/554]EAJ5693211.1 cell filamentation protein Fic [Campylobacter fetus]EAJ5705135.1 cell filamentation protein Fic [Campylobacter fetus]EAJ9257423.1 cell filamentation protein Fic [Campylobacter fetus]